MQLSETEERILEIMRKKLAESVGVTLVDDNLTLRFREDKMVLHEVSLIVVNIRDGNKECCHNCGADITFASQYEALQKTFDGKNLLYQNKVILCIDCYSPK